MRKILYGFAGLVSVVAIVAAVWEPLSARAGDAPPTKSYDVEIVRDPFGVPHINGKTDADAAYGLAYAHSEDEFSDH
jgi:acyl-homoserine-lactone acylase